MEMIKTNSLSAAQKEHIFHLWNAEYPLQLQFSTIQDFENYLRALGNPTHYLALDEDKKIAAWAFVFEREQERWFAIIVDSQFQRSGLGTKILAAIKLNECLLNGWVTDHDRYKKADGTIYLSPEKFYRKNDFIFCDDIRLETEKLSAIKIKWASKK